MRTQVASVLVWGALAASAPAGKVCNQVDLDNSGTIDSGDLNVVLAGFGCSSSFCLGDVNADGSTDSLDLNLVLGMFGDVCGPFSCCEVHGPGGCDDSFCAEFLCSIFPPCCEVAWDFDCVLFTDHYCGCSNVGPCCMGEGGSCTMEFNEDCIAMGGTLMPTGLDCQLVYCITPTPPCGEPSAGPCWEPSGTPGCSQPACCMETCAVDPFCCEVVWDQICVDEGCNVNCYACGCCAP